MNRQMLTGAVRVGILACISAALLGCPTGPATLSPTLSVNPNVVGFGAAGVEESVAIFNSGGGTLSWTASGDAAWLSCNKSSGSLTNTTDHVKLTVDRTGMQPGTYNATLTIASNGGTKTVGVAMQVPGTPQLVVTPGTVNFLGAQKQEIIRLQNTGDDALIWNVAVLDPSDPLATIVPAYLTFDALSGGIAAGREGALTVTLDRDAMTAEDPSTLTLRISSNGGVQPVTVNISQAIGATVATDPELLEFGTKLNQLTFNVWNDGPQGSSLTFNVTTDRPGFISVNPPSGTSVGTSAEVKDIVSIGVTIDRTQLQGDSDSGHVIITTPGSDPIKILVTADAAPITFEGATNRSRPPFIERFVFTLRDSAGRTIDSNNPAILEELRTGLSINEDRYPIDLDETNFFVQNGSNLKYNVTLLLDYTGSMFRAGDGQGSAIDEMVKSAKAFISDLPPSYRASVMEYHERQQTTRLIHGFSTLRSSILGAMDTFSVPDADHGASEILDAIIDACTRLENEDQGVLPFNDADVRSLVFISDGRDTSSVNSITEAIKKAKDARVRLYPIGFGQGIDSSMLVQLATETGGHYYAAPTVPDLVKLLDHDSAAAPEAPGIVVTDLSRQVVLTYITLYQEGSHTYMIRADYRGQQGYIDQDGVYALGGDVRAGQVALTTSGIDPDGKAEVYVRADYLPRNITQFRFRFLTDKPFTLEKVADGLIPDWTVVSEGNGVYTLLTTEDKPLRYGAFGNLVKLTFTGVPDGAFPLGFRMDNLIYVNPPFTKFFQYPLGTVVSRTFSSTDSVAPILLSDGFDPDAAGAFDFDKDAFTDFDDLFPEDPDLH